MNYDDPFSSLELIWRAALWLILGVGVPLVNFSVLYFLFSQPLRRQERARFLLDLLEREIKRGRSPEHAILSLAQCRDRALGRRFFSLAAHIEKGLRLDAGLNQVRHLFPARINAMLQAGERIGDLAKVLPICRRSLTDAASQTTGAANYFFVLFLSNAPFLLSILVVLNLFVMPKFSVIAADMGSKVGATTFFLIQYGPWLAAISLAAAGAVFVGGIFYVGGSRSTALWRKLGLQSLADEFATRIPWRWQRAKRDFSAMLSLLLDAEVPEDIAVNLAAQATANAVMIGRASKVVADLRAGKKLTEAIHWIDEAGEFRWRLANAAHAHTGFVAALTGWHEALDAKAFQAEQAAAQTITTGLVLFNGVFVGGVCIAVFQILISLIDQGTLW